MLKQVWKWTLHADFQITRRKRYHMLLDEKEEVLHSTPRLSDTLEYILENDQSAVRVCHEGKAYLIEISRLPLPPVAARTPKVEV